MEKKLHVQAIAHGTVIDHIPAGQGIKILKFFELTNQDKRITIGLNLRSGDGSKDLIKIEDTVFAPEQANQLALFAPNATINVIDNYEVVQKFRLELPESIHGVLTCPNSNCITHNEPVETKFTIDAAADSTYLKCHYCEKRFAQSMFKQM